VNRYIAAHKGQFGVEPICQVLEVAPSTYYASQRHEPSRRAQHDAVLKDEIRRVHEENFGVYGTEKVWRQLAREGWAVGRDHVKRLMRDLSLVGATRRRTTRTTIPRPDAEHPGDLVHRDFTATAPNRKWVGDITYVATQEGFAYTTFVIDTFSRRIVGWTTARTLSAEATTAAFEMAAWCRRGNDIRGVIAHTDKGCQFTSVHYTTRLEELGAVRSIGTVGDSYDNALAETVNGLYKAELIWRRRSWRTIAEVEAATAAWVEWWNNRRLHSACGWLPPAEFEARAAGVRAAA
jgi:putative transposase